MLRICSLIFCLFLISTNKVYLQDKIAKTADGQTVILKEDGTWNVLNNIAIHDNKAITNDGKLVLLGQNGKWFLINAPASSPSQRQGANQLDEKEFRPEFDKVLVQASNELNKNLPMVLDKDTRLDTTIPGPGNRFTYFYTMLNYTVEQLDTNKLRSILTPNLINNYKTNKSMDEFRENNVELHYFYRDKNGKSVFDIAVPASIVN
jgi:hypothetical protein